MVSFNDVGTEAEALSDQDDFAYERRGRAPTRYTNCRYCGKRFPLREISAHARNAHYEESTRYTNCWKCGDRFPLREIRAHARACAGMKETERGTKLDAGGAGMSEWAGGTDRCEGAGGMMWVYTCTVCGDSASDADQSAARVKFTEHSTTAHNARTVVMTDVEGKK